MGTRPASGTWVLGPTLGLLVSWVRGSWGSQLMGLARAPARLVLRLARLVRLALRHLARRHLSRRFVSATRINAAISRMNMNSLASRCDARDARDAMRATRARSVCARFSVCTRFSVRNPLKARFLQIGKVWSHFGKISKRKALGHSAKGCRTCHRRAHRSRGSCCSSSSSGARWMQLGGARSRTHERGTPARLGDRSARLSYTALTARGGILKNLGEK